MKPNFLPFRDSKTGNLLFRDQDAEVVIWSSGRVKMTVRIPNSLVIINTNKEMISFDKYSIVEAAFSVTTDCATEAGFFPRDYLNCSFTLYTPVNANK